MDFNSSKFWKNLGYVCTIGGSIFTIIEAILSEKETNTYMNNKISSEVKKYYEQSKPKRKAKTSK